MRFLPIDDSLLERLEAMGFRRAAVTKMNVLSWIKTLQPWTSAAGWFSRGPTFPMKLCERFAMPLR